MLSIQVTFSNGEKFEIPANAVAEPRAEYYSKREDNDEDKLKVYTSELHLAMTDKFTLLDWIQNNMNWEDVKHAAKKLPMQNINVDFDKEFINAEFIILEIPKVLSK